MNDLSPALIRQLQLYPESIINQIERDRCEDSLYEFLKGAWHAIDPAKWRDGWASRALAEHLEAVIDGQITRLIINIPPRTLKTSLCGIALPAFTWAQPRDTPTSGPGVKFMYASYGEELSLEHSVKCRRLIKSDWYQRHWGDRYDLMADQDTKHAFANSKGGERQITSITGRVTGRGSQILIIDDPNAANEAMSDAKKFAVNEWFDQTASSRLNDRETGAFILVQQRLAEDDLSGYLLEKKESDWEHLMLPMRFESDRSFHTSIGWKDPRVEEGQLLWPERFSEAAVEQIERDIGPWGFAGQYQQRPEPKGGGIIKRDWWLAWPDTAFPPMDYIMASLDTAYTEKTENDYSALTVWGVFTTDPVAQASRVLDMNGRPMYIDRTFSEAAPKVMLMHAWQERLPLHELVLKVGETCKKLKVNLLLIENKASGISVAQEIRRLYGHEEFGVQLKDPKGQDKLARLYSCQHIWAEGMIYAPNRAWADMVITQVGQFPRGKHDDLVDTCSQAIRHLRDTGLLVRGPERIAEIEDMKQFTGRASLPLYPA